MFIRNSWGPGFHMALRHGGFNNSISIVSGHFSGDNMRHVLRLHEISHPESSVLWLAWEFMNGWTNNWETAGWLIQRNVHTLRKQPSATIVDGSQVLTVMASKSAQYSYYVVVFFIWGQFHYIRFVSFVLWNASHQVCHKHWRFHCVMCFVSKNKWLELKWPWINTIQ